MARSTRTSLAGQVASVARKAVSRRPSAPEPGEPAAAAPAKKAPAKKAPARKAPATKSASTAKKAPAKKSASAARKAPATKAAGTAKKTPAKKASTATTVGKKAEPTTTPQPTRAAPRTATKKQATSATPAKKAPVKKTASTRSPKSPRSSATASVAKAPVGALAVKEGEDAWTKAELEEVLGELHDQRDHSVSILEQQEIELSGLMRDSGDGAGHDQADMGATSFERDHELTVVNIEREKVAQIDRALARIENGTYGVCESCGNPIGKMRVMAFPRATLCLTCKQREERR